MAGAAVAIGTIGPNWLKELQTKIALVQTMELFCLLVYRSRPF